MNITPIEWTTFSANPLKYRAPDGRVVWACEKLSDGCKNCYAEALSHRYGGARRAGDWNASVMSTLTPFLDEAELHKMLTAKTIGGVPVSGSMCFVGDMTDVFGEWVPDALLDRLFAVFALRPDVTWQVLTKRSARKRAYFSAAGVLSRIAEQAKDIYTSRSIGRMDQFKIYPVGPSAEFGHRWFLHPFPLPNVWLVVSVEDQPRADERIPDLLQTPAAVRGVSYEPALGPVDLRRFIGGEDDDGHCVRCGCAFEEGVTHDECPPGFGPRLDWVIVGVESRGNAVGRNADDYEQHARAVLQQCAAAGVAAFHKQMPVRGRVSGEPSEWRDDLRVRQFPEIRA